MKKCIIPYHSLAPAFKRKKYSGEMEQPIYSKEGGEGEESGSFLKLGDWDWHIYTIDTMCKIDNCWEHTV